MTRHRLRLVRAEGWDVGPLRVTPAGELSSRAKLALAGEILAAYALTRASMSQRDLRGVVAPMRSRAAQSADGDGEVGAQAPVVAARLGRAVSRTLRVLPTDSTCLMRALVLSRLLTARGMSSTLVIAARSNASFAAHAWVEVAGVPVLPSGGFETAKLVEI